MGSYQKSNTNIRLLLKVIVKIALEYIYRLFQDRLLFLQKSSIFLVEAWDPKMCPLVEVVMDGDIEK